MLHVVLSRTQKMRGDSGYTRKKEKHRQESIRNGRHSEIIPEIDAVCAGRQTFIARYLQKKIPHDKKNPGIEKRRKNNRTHTDPQY